MTQRLHPLFPSFSYHCHSACFPHREGIFINEDRTMSSFEQLEG